MESAKIKVPSRWYSFLIFLIWVVPISFLKWWGQVAVLGGLILVGFFLERKFHLTNKEVADAESMGMDWLAVFYVGVAALGLFAFVLWCIRLAW